LSTTSHEPLNVVLCWHMHQPWYWVDGAFAQPWVYLHAIKDYSDMAAHLETVPGARAVVNFVPVLLDQIEMYRNAIARFLDAGAAIADPLLDALARLDLPRDAQQRNSLIGQCRHVSEKHVLARYPAYARLIALATHAEQDGGRYLNDGYFADLLVWFHLAWLGEHVRRHDERVKQLLGRERDYTPADRRILVTIIGEVLGSVVSRYSQLQRDGRVELSVSPWAHPILPLLLDFASARAALPHIKLPSTTEYPGGAERVRWHLDEASTDAKRHFGITPRGCWPSEGGVSGAALAMIGAAGYRWSASGGGVLTNSLAAAQQTVHCTHRPFVVDGVACFFRDDGLSDLIGFNYKDWHAEDAVANLVGHLENIGRHCNRNDAVVAIVLDGENAWESYPGNAYDFLQTLYRALVAHPSLRLTTFSDYLDEFPTAAPSLAHVVAGSWVYGTFSTWIGEPDKNRAWELLLAAKQRFDQRRSHLTNLAECEKLLAICEGSDWFWWLGANNAAEPVARFEALFRAHLRELYVALGEPVPVELTVPLGHGSVHGAVHTMRASIDR
jgi:alpha-amylase/alpha-mannosidase (GH57 family)